MNWKENWKLLIFWFIYVFVSEIIILEIFFRLTGEFPVSPTNIIAFFSEAIISAIILLIGSLIIFKFTKK